MSGCAAVGCSNRGDKGFFMKSFPRDPKRRALWASHMKRDSWQPNNNSRLCEVHFDDDQWERTRQDGTRKLKCNAVPTLFQYSKKMVKRKGRKSKFIAPLEAEAPLTLNALSDDELKASAKFAKSLETNKSQDVRQDLEKQSSFYTDSRIKCETEEESMNFGSKSQNLISHETNKVQSELQRRLCDEMTDLSSFTSETEQRFTFPTLHKEYDCSETRNSDLREEGESKAYRSLCLGASCELFDTMEKREMTELKDTCCRLCASSGGKNYIPIFGESDLAEKISRCLPIIVLPNDNLPLHVCQQCLYNLNISYKLIIGSLRADSFLRSEYLQTSMSDECGELFETRTTELSNNYSATSEEPVFRINGPIKCDLCDDLFQDMDMFDAHIETRHLLQWHCSLCDHSFETSQELVTHKTLHHSGQILSCKNCINANLVGEIDLKVPEIFENDVNLPLDRLVDNSSEAKEVEAKLTDLSCTKCKIVFNNVKQFREHHAIHLPRHLKCSLCHKRCPSIFDYLTHNRIVHNKIKRNNLSKRNIVHSCNYCKKVFLIKQQLVVHLRKHKKEMFDDPSVTVYKCVTCPKKFVDRALYQKHRNVHDPACWHKFRCYICSRSFMDKFKLKLHQSIHDGVKPYQCDVCGQMFNRNANMIRHRIKHLEQTCRHCQKAFPNTRSLREHLKDIHGDTLMPKSNSKATKAGKRTGGNKANGSDDNFICRYCGKQLTSYNSLLDHERIHTGDKPYVCQHCGKAFRSITARWDHMVRHEKGNYICELCGKMMSNKLNLRRHLRKHAAIEQRRFECNECGKLFHVRWRLNAHLIRIHHSPPSN